MKRVALEAARVLKGRHACPLYIWMRTQHNDVHERVSYNPHAGPAAPDLRLVDAAGARRRAPRRADGHRAPPPRPGDVRAGRAAASPARAVPGLPGPERRVLGAVLGTVRL